MEENEEQIVCFERICRLCLNDKQTLTDIFEPTADNNNFSIDQKIMACATIALSKDDGLPSRICVKCLTSVNAAFDFRVQCENADKTLHILHNLLTGETDKGKSDKAAPTADAVVENTNEEIEKSVEKNAEKEKIDLEQVILVKKGANEDKIEEDNGNLFYIIKDNGGGLMEGIISDAEIIYFDNGCNSEMESGCGKSATEAERMDEDKEVLEEEEEMEEEEEGDDDDDDEEEEEEEGEEEIGEKGEEAEGEAAENEKAEGDEMEGEEADCSRVGFELQTDSSGDKGFQILVKSSNNEVSLNEAQLKALKKNGDDMQKTPCPHCHKLLSRVDEHVRLMHRNRVYICDKFGCGAQFTTLKNLQSHQLTCYDLKKAYKCLFCLKEFHRKSNYKAHVKRHNSRKEFKCELCDSAFVDTTGLKRHFLKHHEPDREMFVSHCCGKRFKSKEGLRKHINKRICGIQVLEVVDPSPIEVPM